jgi:hypothetical protein
MKKILKLREGLLKQITTKRLSKKNPQIMLIGTGIAFIVSGIDCMENNLVVIAIASFIVGLINIISCFYIIKYPFFVKISLLIINSIFAFLSSYKYFEAGRDKIQYGWLAVGIVSLIIAGITYRKEQKKRRLEYAKDSQEQISDSLKNTENK